MLIFTMYVHKIVVSAFLESHMHGTSCFLLYMYYTYDCCAYGFCTGEPYYNAMMFNPEVNADGTAKKREGGYM